LYAPARRHKEAYTLNISSDKWAAGDAYETFMGRWSQRVAHEFLEWLAPAPDANWLEMGCGTGALTQAICQRAKPASVVACDPSSQLLTFARNSITGCPVTFLTGSADDLPSRDGGFDAIVSGLVLNFVPHPLTAVQSMMARARRGGVLAAYVWDYAEGMQFLRIFWDEAVALDPSAADLHEGRRFPLCRSEALTQLFEQAGASSVETRSFEIDTTFPDFDAFWSPFLGGTGPGPSYVDSLDPEARSQLMFRLKQRLAPSDDGVIRLTAGALGVRALADV
jgi:trans-aconitate methyltransferase